MYILVHASVYALLTIIMVSRCYLAVINGMTAADIVLIGILDV